jgi:hypothetical protein
MLQNEPTNIIEQMDGNITLDSDSNSDDNESRNHGQFVMKPGLVMPEINT